MMRWISAGLSRHRRTAAISAPPADEPSSAAPAAPPETVVYAIGDIHGRLDLLRRLEAMILADARAHPGWRKRVICLGDAIDRGPDSRAVLDHLMRPWPGFERVMLRGNHEDLLLRFLADPGTGPAWLGNGGVATLESYGVALPDSLHDPDDLARLSRDLAAALPEAHRAFLEGLPYRHREGGYLFVHAGIRPGIALEAQRPEDLMWIRGAFLDSAADHGLVVVHGHSIAPRPQNRANRIGIDTGAFASGRLTAVALIGRRRRFLQT